LDDRAISFLYQINQIILYTLTYRIESSYKSTKKKRRLYMLRIIPSAEKTSIYKTLKHLFLPKKNQQDLIEKLREIARITKNQKTQQSYLQSYLRIYREGIDKDGRGSSVVVELTKRCSKNCPHCYSRSSNTTQDISDELLDIVIQYAKKYLKHVFLTGGEPTLDPRVFTLADTNPDIMFFIFTNGSTMTEEYAKKLSSRGNLIPLLSIDGSTPATHNQLRGEGSYQEVMAAIENLNTHGVPWGFISLVTEKNAHDVLDQRFIDDKINKGAILMRYIEYLPVGPNPQPDLILSGETYCLLEKRKKEIVASGKIYMQEISQTKCNGLLYITVNGDLKNCFCFHYSKYNIRSNNISEAIMKTQKDWLSYCWEGECPIYADPIGFKNHLEKKGWNKTSSLHEEYLVNPLIAKLLSQNYKRFLEIKT
jgi:MoaA/NifB/PqqE/SkfB family radical SAM enzyme